MKIFDLHELFLEQNQNFTTDTRKITKGSIFFALKGDNFNGNEFAAQALENGAAYVVIDDAAYYDNTKTILVNNVLETLQRLAFYHREHLNLPIIALTGSNGKTTTKELIKAVLATQFNITATAGNLNNHLGVPFTLLSMTPETQIGIVEMGANHLNEIATLSYIAAPNFGYITNFGKAHIEGFGSEEGIVQGKSELYNYLANAEGIAFVNEENKRQLEMSDLCDQIFIKPSETPLIDLTPFVKINYKETAIESKLIGKYNYTNILAAISIGEYFGIEENNIKKAIENYTPTNNRSQIIEKNGNQIILDAYNANPSSMVAALDNLNSLKATDKAVILGDMFELGDTAPKEHLNIVNKVLEQEYMTVIFVGENFYKHKNNNALFFKNYDELKNYQTLNITESTLLIKGSRGMALERVLDII
ncbi:UDP-N-acetylmuramoyl-tripeptide--D-alanyl-D-alanine ligase [Flavobacteriaceae bacterium]|nr:UDP-N-acetylmuramoyl-tripeptide--D-alanyl-D-alanine ligase [Flavobacteriaceae bacterium]